jgi:hypothetical protein
MFASFVLGRTLAHRRAANHDFASYFLNRRPPAHVSGEFLGLCSFRERERERERERGGQGGRDVWIRGTYFGVRTTRPTNSDN